MNKKNIVVAQFSTSNLSYSSFTEAINKKYCEEKGYTYFCEKDSYKIYAAIEKRAPTWYKPKLIEDVIDQYNPEYILFMDIDAVISDFNQNIEDFIDDNYNIIFTEDVGHHSAMNAGIFLMKNTEWSRNFLKTWWVSADNFTPEDSRDLSIMEQNFGFVGYFKQALWHDQTCLTILYENNEDIKNNISIISNKSLNHNEYGEGNFIFHAYAYGHVENRTLDLIYHKVFDIPFNTLDTTNIPDIAVVSNKLSDIVDPYITDKHHSHNYFKLIYDDLFEPIQNNVEKFVEVGIDKGGSLELWRDYFKNATVYGLDINIGVNINPERIELKQLDQSNIEHLKEFAQEHTEIDVIMDDGSHKMYDQQITLATLFKSLKPGGIYVLEDLHTSLEVIMPEKNWCGWGDPNKTITLNMLNNWINTGKIESDYLTQEDKEYLNNNIKSISIHQSRPDWSITSVITKR